MGSALARQRSAEVLKVLLGEEVAGRERSALATRRAQAAFPTGKTFDTWDPNLSSIPTPTQTALRTLDWIGRRQNLVICGPSGTGTTFWLEGLGQLAVEAGLNVAWFSLENLGVLVRRHRADDSVTKAVKAILRAKLIVVDDIGLLPVSPDAAEGFSVGRCRVRETLGGGEFQRPSSRIRRTDAEDVSDGYCG
jgi:DNA replication protein DnaC